MEEKKPLVQIVRFSSILTADKLSSCVKYNNLETYSILWLDPVVNDAKEYIEAQQRLRTSINYIRTFKTIDNWEQYIQTVPEQDRIFLIINNQFGQELIPQIHQYQQIIAIYIYINDDKRNTQWTKEFKKIKSVSTQLDSLVGRIKSDRTRRSQNKIDEPLSINIFDVNVSYKSNEQFIRSHLLIDCLLRIKENSTDIENFITLCEEEYKDNKAELDQIHEFQQNYSSNRALRWYTKQIFLFRMLNKALRIQNLDVLFLFRFFIDDIQQQLIKNQYSQQIQLYRVQLISNNELEILKKATGGFIMTNTFLSTTLNREASFEFFNNMESSDEINMHRVLFEIDANPRIDGVKPFANIIWLSHCFGQQEVLLMVGSIFRIINIEHNDNEMCTIRLVLSSENDQDLKNSFEHLKKEYNDKEMDLFSFGHVLYDMGNFDSAKKFYLRFLDNIPPDHQDLANCYNTLGEIAVEKGDCNLSLEWFEKLNELLIRTLNPNDPRLADSHTIIGDIYWKKNDLKHALESYNKGLAIYKRACDENHFTIAVTSEKIGAIYEKQKKYFQALNYYEKTLAIRQKTLPSDDLLLGATHSKVANIRLSLCHYYLAIGHYNIALKIKLTTLPPDHLEIASDYRGIGHMYKGTDNINQALIYYGKALEIYRQHLPPNHPDIIEIERIIVSLAAQTE
ncbi:unnamed protein product [Adineta steineri]|uniref:Uncharacterized protein n=1 Tax=Adineta steineri TaxID=433720 RepID=A0A813M8V0_9BILA|nr:unnamed protein product [Adineta steineri]CAF3829095.1 unnamed protein product [Adineta steineri]